MDGSSRFRPMAAAFGATLAVITAWIVFGWVSDFLDSRKVVLDSATIKYSSISGEWSIQAYNGSGRRVKAVLVQVTVPITETKRTFRLEPRGLLGGAECAPYSVGEFRGNLGGFLPDRRIHGVWKLAGVEFSGRRFR